MTGRDDLLLGAVWYAVLLFSLSFHEAAHAWVAQRGGDATAYRGGQVTLDPRPHIRREPMGTVLVPLLSFAMAGWMIGWASTPYDPRWADRHPRRAALMSLAGPAANLALVIVAAVCIRVGLAAGVFYPPHSINFSRAVAAHGDGIAVALAPLLSVLFTLNLLLCVFNLLPLPPLDGAGAIGLLLGDDAARQLRKTFADPRFAWAGLVAAWLIIRELFGPIHLAAINLLHPGVGYG